MNEIDINANDIGRQEEEREELTARNSNDIPSVGCLLVFAFFALLVCILLWKAL